MYVTYLIRANLQQPQRRPLEAEQGPKGAGRCGAVYRVPEGLGEGVLPEGMHPGVHTKVRPGAHVWISFLQFSLLRGIQIIQISQTH